MVIANSARLAGDSKVIRDEDREEGSTYLAKAKGHKRSNLAASF